MIGITIRDESAYTHEQKLGFLLTTPRGTSIFRPKGSLAKMGSKDHWIATVDFTFSDFCRMHELRLLLKDHLAMRNFTEAAWSDVNEYNLLQEAYNRYKALNHTLNGLQK